MTGSEWEWLRLRLEVEGLQWHWENLPATIWALYRRRQKGAEVLLSKILCGQPNRLVRSVVFEELGHHHTLEPSVPVAWPIYSQQIHASRQETRALRWAAEHLISEEEWYDVGADCGWNVEVMAEALDVTRALVDAYTNHVMCQPDHLIRRIGEHESSGGRSSSLGVF